MSIEPVRDKAKWIQGATFDITWQFFQPQTEEEVAAGVAPVPENFTGCTAKGQLRKEITDPMPAVILELLNGVLADPPATDVIELGAAAGTMRIYVRDETTATHAYTAFKSVGGGKYTGILHVEIENTKGERHRYLELTVTLSREGTL